jgi:hypothetical protein
MPDTSNSVILFRGQPCQNIHDFDAKPSSGNKGVHRGITSDRKAIGFRKGQKPDWSLSFKYTDQEGGQAATGDPDWEALWASEEEFDLARENDASTELWPQCIVSEIGAPTENDGTTTRSVTLLALFREFA